jgi:hypothetical protein
VQCPQGVAAAARNGHGISPAACCWYCWLLWWLLRGKFRYQDTKVQGTHQDFMGTFHPAAAILAFMKILFAEDRQYLDHHTSHMYVCQRSADQTFAAVASPRAWLANLQCRCIDPGRAAFRAGAMCWVELTFNAVPWRSHDTTASGLRWR